MTEPFPYFVHPEDAEVIRDPENHPGIAALIDADGEQRASFPESWTDQQIMHALGFANRAYHLGTKVGAEHRAVEIRRALGL